MRAPITQNLLNHQDTGLDEDEASPAGELQEVAAAATNSVGYFDPLSGFQCFTCSGARRSFDNS